MNTKRKRPKIAVFIRDAPSFGKAPIAARLLANLAKEDVYPVYSYSVLDLLKDKRNVEKMRALSLLGNPKGSDDAVLVARGCDILLRHLFERAMRSCPELILVDYLSETFVDIRRMTKITKKLNYKMIFLKGNFSAEQAIQDAIAFITSHIRYQNHAEIWCQREADKWWHEIDRIFLPSHSIHNDAEISSFHYSPYLHKLHSQSAAVTSITSNKYSHIKCSECIAKQVECYYSKLEELASMLSGDYESIRAWEEVEENNPEPLPSVNTGDNNIEDPENTGPHFTLIVIDDFHFRRTSRARLIDLLLEKIIQEDIPFHLIPIGQLVTLPEFQVLFDWYCGRSDMDVMDTYSYLFLDTFLSLYKKESIVLLDNIHEGIVMSSYYISKAVEKNWEVLVLRRDKFWPPNDEEIVEKVMERMRGKYGRNKEERERASSLNTSAQNCGFGDIATYLL